MTSLTLYGVYPYLHQAIKKTNNKRKNTIDNVNIAGLHIKR